MGCWFVFLLLKESITQLLLIFLPVSPSMYQIMYQSSSGVTKKQKVKKLRGVKVEKASIFGEMIF